MITRFVHGPIIEKDGTRGKCRTCGEWYEIPEAGYIPPHQWCPSIRNAYCEPDKGEE